LGNVFQKKIKGKKFCTPIKIKEILGGGREITLKKILENVF
jgi:hypothetical protein